MRNSLLFLALVACASGTKTPGTTSTAAPPEAKASRYKGPSIAPTLQIDVSQMSERPSGLFVHDIVPGTGIPAQVGDFVRVEYTLYLADGTRVEGTPPNESFEVRLGQHQVIAGWEEGLTGMKNGGRRHLIVPPTLGYGMRTRGKVPGGSTLVFDLKVVYVGR